VNATIDSIELLAVDRCDSCGAQARTIVTLASGELMFCGHHSREFGSKLIEQAIGIYDPDKYIS